MRENRVIQLGTAHEGVWGFTDKEEIIKKIDKLVDDTKRNRLYHNEHRLSEDTRSIVTLVSLE